MAHANTTSCVFLTQSYRWLGKGTVDLVLGQLATTRHRSHTGCVDVALSTGAVVKLATPRPLRRIPAAR